MRKFAAAALALSLLAAACGGDDDDNRAATPGASATSDAAGTPVAGETSTPHAASCSPSREHDAGESRRTFTHGDFDRRYLLIVPDGYDGAVSTPLVIALHGLGADAESMREMTAIDVAAGERDMITVLPEGTGAQPGWNIDDVPAGPDDVAFLDALVSELESVLCVDPTRVYVGGFSNGGGMAQKFACAKPERVVAVGLVAATYKECAAPVPLIAFHGSEDPAAPFQGGEIRRGVTLPSVPDAIIAWAAAVGCAEPPPIADLTEEIRVAAYDGCPSGLSDVQLYTILGGGHTWPGSSVENPDAGTTTQAINATNLMLDFFRDYVRSDE